MPQVILASKSKQRLLLMQTLGIDFEVIPAEIDEKVISGKTVEEKASSIALAKALKVQENHKQAIIIASDTFTYFNDKVFEKPEDLEEAREMLNALSGQKIIAYTGFAYLEPQKTPVATTAVTTAYFRDLTSAEIDRYINSNPVLTWAGGYSAAYSEGAALIGSIEGSLTGFTHGFPMEELVPRLRESGVLV